ncbi:MAG: hypothetical protein KIS30_04235 [Thermoplasmata archaeon]|nr:hypothetical protein [Candidatus Sysuiplasma acidicola]MBX8645952.1 hypothetical protein [Candidatus Sysuiplasma acidicola]MDH2906010.1 hypothetical protein [Methanomassiliicoccales archaeon]
MDAERAGNPFVAYARAILITRVLGIFYLLIGLLGLYASFMITTSITSEIILLGNDGLTTNNFTYINRISSYNFMLFIIFLVLVLVLTVPIHLYQGLVAKRTLEVTGTANVADLRRKTKEQGGILRLSLTKRNS